MRGNYLKQISKNAKSIAKASAVAAGTAVTASAATLTVAVPTAYSDGVDTSAVVTVVGIIGGAVIGIALAVKLVRWVMAIFV